MNSTYKSNYLLPDVATLWDDFLGRGTSNKDWKLGTSTPAVNVEEEKDQYSVKLAVPGMQKEDFSIEIKGTTLFVSCEKEASQAEQQKNYTRKEFSYHSFQRFFDLPHSVDTERIVAEYNKGILEIRLPKKTPKNEFPMKKIPIA